MRGCGTAYRRGAEINRYTPSTRRRSCSISAFTSRSSTQVYSDFEDYAGGIYHHVSGGMAGGHAVKFVGWGVDDDGTAYWQARNSWGTYWGEQGWARVVRGTNNLGIEITAEWTTPKL